LLVLLLLFLLLSEVFDDDVDRIKEQLECGHLLFAAMTL